MITGTTSTFAHALCQKDHHQKVSTHSGTCSIILENPTIKNVKYTIK